MKRIVIDARELRTSTGRYVERLIYHLQDIDTDLKHRYIILLKPKDLEGWKPRSKRFRAVACSAKEFTFAEQTRLLFQLWRLRPNLVHFGMTQQPVLYFGRTVTTMHDLTTLRFDNPAKNKLIFTIKQWVYERVIHWVARKSRHIMVPTEYVKDDIAKYTRSNSRKITVTYEGSDQVSATAEAVPELVDQPFIMYVGRPTPHKNLGRLIDAFAIIKQSQPDLKLVLVGKTDSNYRRMERYVAKRGVPDVIFTGFVEDSQLHWLYENCAAYAFPSLSEGFGLPAVEAMASGAPVAASNATCIPEVLGDAAVYFDPLDVDDMAKVITRVLTKPELRRELVKAGRKQSAKYSWKRMAEQTLAIYKSALGEK
jgi:glycosyltransferase involved in cell wall biosynthesis